MYSIYSLPTVVQLVVRMGKGTTGTPHSKKVFSKLKYHAKVHKHKIDWSTIRLVHQFAHPKFDTNLVFLHYWQCKLTSALIHFFFVLVFRIIYIFLQKISLTTVLSQPFCTHSGLSFLTERFPSSQHGCHGLLCDRTAMHGLLRST